MSRWTASIGAALLAATATTAAHAQAPSVSTKQGSPTSAAEPARTTATYGDWVLTCTRTGDGATALRNCEIIQTLVQQGKPQPIAQIALGSLNSSSPIILIAVLPVAISLAKAPQVTTADANSRVLQLTWRRCLPRGCFADVSLNTDMLKTLRSATEPARLTFQNAGDRDVTLPVSLSGLTQALDALAKETAKRQQ